MRLDVLIKKLILWIPKNLAGILGLVQSIAKLVREIAMVILRLLCPLLSFGPDGKTDERVVTTIGNIADKADKFIEAWKNKLLVVGE